MANHLGSKRKDPQTCQTPLLVRPVFAAFSLKVAWYSEPLIVTVKPLI